MFMKGVLNENLTLILIFQDATQLPESASAAEPVTSASLPHNDSHNMTGTPPFPHKNTFVVCPNHSVWPDV